MKYTFDNSGVGQKQASVVALPDAELRAEVDFIRTDFKGWMRESFDLLPHQDQQLDIMPADFTFRLANAIADHFEKRTMVQFNKETRANENSDDLKELILFGLDEITFTLTSTPSVLVPELAIFIRYKQNL
ncbi:hypothetical protein [Sphingobacterium sp. SGR-19]|uniref:hypothetical protein n=1 Tax=Sphingobacterium sp. SGR-19 TaxID=2710886 RepID=UPI0013EC199F|nr:hypothetical protein [Sphingobacterium sp. SGR-19]NGM67329.1 hypothetical protein [Sphingobacterium sp. SGR-19]